MIYSNEIILTKLEFETVYKGDSLNLLDEQILSFKINAPGETILGVDDILTIEGDVVTYNINIEY